MAVVFGAKVKETYEWNEWIHDVAPSLSLSVLLLAGAK